MNMKPLIVYTKKEAWHYVNKIFNQEYYFDQEASKKAGYDIYRGKEDPTGWISDLGDRLEVNLPNGETFNIWIEN